MTVKVGSRKHREIFKELIDRSETRLYQLDIGYDCPVIQIVTYDPKTGMGTFALAEVLPLI